MFNTKLFQVYQKGQGLLEYALIIALIIIVVIAALSPLGNAIKVVYQDILAAL